MNDTLDHDLQALSTLDPAGPAAPEAHRRAEASALLASITATPRREAATPAPEGDELAERRRRRWPLLAGAAAALTIGLVLTPNILGGNAYGSWTDVPQAASADDAQAAESYCRDWWLSTTDIPGEGLPDSTVVEQAELVIAEQRGDFTYTVLADGEWSMDCLVRSGGIRAWVDRGSAGSIGPIVPAADVPADGVASVSAGGMGGSEIEDLVLMMHGQVGAAVRDVVAHVPGVGSVAASVTNGFFAVWAPGMTAEGFADPGVSLTLYLNDGTQIDLTADDVLNLATT